MTSAIEWVRAMQAEGWVVAYVEVAEAIGAAIVDAGLVTSGQIRPETYSGRICLITVDGSTFQAVLSQ
jgi:hypothetical protein